MIFHSYVSLPEGTTSASPRRDRRKFGGRGLVCGQLRSKQRAGHWPIRNLVLEGFGLGVKGGMLRISIYICMYVCIYIYITCVYVYIYITCICIYIYNMCVYVYLYMTCVYVYIYIYNMCIYVYIYNMCICVYI